MEKIVNKPRFGTIKTIYNEGNVKATVIEDLESGHINITVEHDDIVHTPTLEILLPISSVGDYNTAYINMTDDNAEQVCKNILEVNEFAKRVKEDVLADHPGLMIQNNI